MAGSIKRVCRFNLWIDPIFDATIRAQADIVLEIGDLQGPAAPLCEMLAGAHVYQITAARDELPRPWHVTEALLARCPNLLAVSSGGAGFDTVDAAACTRAGVAVLNQVGGNARSVAELAVGLMLAVSRKICVSDRKLRTERGFARESLMGHEIGGATLGIVGIGHTGRHLAKLARGFEMRVLAYDPLLSADEIHSRGAEPVDWAQLLSDSDIVSVHCPLDDTTRGSFDARAFSAMKPGALFVTTARGGVHDEAALAEALTSGHLAGAGLDVWAPEPPPHDNPLLDLDTVVATYHTAGVTHEARRTVAVWGAEQVIGLLRGETPPRIANPEVWPTVLERQAALFG